MQDAESQETTSVLFCTVILLNSLSKKATLIFWQPYTLTIEERFVEIFFNYITLFFFKKGNDFT